TANDVDTDNALLTVQNLTLVGTDGTISENADGTWTFSPNKDFNGEVRFNFEINDSAENNNITKVTGTVTVDAVNDAPIANHEVNNFRENDHDIDPATGNVLSNDTDVDNIDLTEGDKDTNQLTVNNISFTDESGDVQNVEVESGSSSTIVGKYGELTINSDGTYSYITDKDAVDALPSSPDDGNNGYTREKFEYTITDPDGEKSQATLCLDILGENDAPAIDLDGDSHLKMTFVSESASFINIFGVYQVDANGENPSDPQVFINDQNALTTGSNHVLGTLPEGHSYQYFLISDGGRYYPDLADNELSFTSANGKIILNVNGDPSAKSVYFSQMENNPDTLNGSEETSGNKANDGTPAPGHFIITTEEGGTTLIRMEDVKNGGDKDYLDVVVRLSPAEGSDGTGYHATFIEDAGQVYVASAGLTIADVDSTTMTTAEIVLTNAMDGDLLRVGNLPENITASTTEDNGKIIVTLSAAEGHTASPADFEAAIRSVSFYNNSETPDTTERIINVTVTDDNKGVSNTATSTISVFARNDAPALHNEHDTASEAYNDNTVAPSKGNLLDNATDAEDTDYSDEGSNTTQLNVVNVSFTDDEGHPHNQKVVNGDEDSTIIGKYGTLTVSADGTYSYVADQQASDALSENSGATETFKYTVIDSEGARSTAKLTFDIEGINDAPTSTPVVVTTNEDTDIIITQETLLATANDVDTDNALLTVQNLTLVGTDGTLSQNTAGEWVFSPNKDFNGEVKFNFDINDGSKNNNITQATGTITVDAVNDAPTIDLNGDNGQIEMTFVEENAAFNNIFGVYVVDENGNPSNPQILITDQNTLVELEGEKIASLPEGLHYEYFLIADGADHYSSTSTLSFETVGDQLILKVNGEASKSPVYFSEDQYNPGGHNHFRTVNNDDGSTTVSMEDLPHNSNNDFDDIVINITPGTVHESTFTEDAGGISIASTDLKIGDVDSATMTNAKIVLTNFKNGDHLNTEDLPDGISASAPQIIDGKLIIILTATDGTTAPLGKFEAAIQSVTFSNESDTPDTADRHIEVTVTDDHNVASNTATATIHVNAINDAPEAINDTASISEDSPTSIEGNVLTNDSDGEADHLTVIKVDGIGNDVGTEIKGQYGKITIKADGSYTYEIDNDNATVQALNDNESLSETITYTVSDGHGGTDTANLEISIAGKDDSSVIIGSNGDENAPINGGSAADILSGDFGGSISGTTAVPLNYNYVVMMDTSGSMDGNDLANMKTAMNTMLNSLQNEVNKTGGTVTLHLMSFDTDVDGAQTYTLTKNGSHAEATTFINNLNAYGGTNYEDAFMDALSWTQSHSAYADQTHALFITDGAPTYYNTPSGIAGNGRHTSTSNLQHLFGISKNDQVNDIANLQNAVDSLRAVAIGMNSTTRLNGANIYIDGIKVDTQGELMNAIDSTGHALVVQYSSDLNQTLDVIIKDTLQLEDAGADQIYGGGGNDLIFGDTINTNTLADLHNINLPEGSGWKVFEELEAKPNWSKDDTRDYIKEHHVELGQETLDSEGHGRQGGDDTISGGSGDDIIYGQEGNDIIYGGDGDDILLGGSGDDILIAGSGNNYIVTGEGADKIIIDKSFINTDSEDSTYITVNDFDANHDSIQVTTDTVDNMTYTGFAGNSTESAYTELLFDNGTSDTSDDIVVKLMGIAPADFHTDLVDTAISSDMNSLIQNIIDHPETNS
ncbi:tandem-95 repeat protein, partial [Maridesulfovibrio ferrireducens]|uniref:tandem-95 repeat protein n=1 Tax=Maridesulfovibrio ferrireducens TaxID=246191 RepID=UPI001A25F3E7